MHLPVAKRAPGGPVAAGRRARRIPAWTTGENSRLLQLLDAIPTAVYRYRHFGNGNEAFVYANAALRRLFDLPWSSRPPSVEALLERIVPEDRAEFFRSRERARSEHRSWQTEFRIRLRGGEIRHLQLHSSPTRGSEGRLWNGTIADVSDLRRTEGELLRAQDAFRLVADEIPGAVFQYVLYPDGHDRVRYMSAGCAALWELPAEAVQADATALWEMVDPEYLEAMARSVTESARSLSRWQFEWRITTPSGRRKWLSAVGIPAREVDGSTSWNTMILDVSDRREAEEQARRTHRRYRVLATQSRDLICLHDAEGRFSYLSPSVETLLGIHWQDLLGQPLEVIAEPEYGKSLRRAFERALAGEGPVTLSFRAQHANGQRLWLEMIVNLADAQDGLVQSTSRDVTERIVVEQQLRHAALHDGLTGLPNRDHIIQRLDAALTGVKRGWLESVALLYADVGRFRLVNDSLGHGVGDDLLLAAARRLQSVVAEQALVARLNGPEFAILFERGVEAPEAQALAERIVRSFDQPFDVAGRHLELTVHVGVVWSKEPDLAAGDLLRDASTAARQRPIHSRSGLQVFDRSMHEQAMERISLEAELRTALAEEQFEVHFQPIVLLATGRLQGLEALVRWPHPTRGPIAPDRFIPVAEESGQIVPLDAWVLRESLKQLGDWRRRGLVSSDVRMSVNLSVPDLEWPGLIEHVQAALAEADVPGHLLCLELTERMLVSDIERTVATLERLRQCGVAISVDDFGTGFSSLGYLHRLPVDALKVDRSFVAKLDSMDADFQLVDTIVTLATRLGLHCIAEGVETETQAQYLRALGCSHAQGWLYGRPLPGSKALAAFTQGDPG
jgi:diguanylate cyclase (GGDEF)-like protein/PAS domain S-box-containing protein